MARKYNDMTDDELRALANQNSADWHTADDAGKQALHGENVDIYGELDRRNGTTTDYDFQSGKWYPHTMTGPNAPASMQTQTQQTSYGTMPTFDVNNAGQYISQYQGLLDNLQSRILNRQPFQYNYETDPVWQAYKTQYNREGDRAMRNTLGEVSARTGGLASSYATTAAAQANDYYNQQLTDKIPELYKLAYSMYNDEGDNLLRQYNLIQGADDTAYGRWGDDYNRQYKLYRDAVGDWWNQNKFDYQKERDAVGDEQWNKTFDYNVSTDQRDFDYKVAQDEQELQMALAKLAAGAGNFDRFGELGLTDAEIEALQNAYLLDQMGGSSGGGGGGSGRRGGSGGSNVSADGIDWTNFENELFTRGPALALEYAKNHKQEFGATNQDGAVGAAKRHLQDLGWDIENLDEAKNGDSSYTVSSKRNPQTITVSSETRTSKYGSGYDEAMNRVKGMLAKATDETRSEIDAKIDAYLDGMFARGKLTQSGIYNILGVAG